MEKIFLNQAPLLEPKRKEKEKAPSTDKLSAVRWKEASKNSGPVVARATREKKPSSLLDEEVFVSSDEWDIEEEEVGSPLSLFNRLETKKRRSSKPNDKVFFNGAPSKKKESEDFEVNESREKEESFDQDMTQDNSSGFQGKGDGSQMVIFSTIDPFIDNRVSETTKISSTPKSALQVKLALLAEKMVQKLLIMKTTGKTEISLTFKSGSFLGAKLSIIEYDSAKGEFNIQFDHLSSKAHALVTNPLNQDILKESLKEKGFTLHTLYATTVEVENLTASSEKKEREFSDNPHPQDDEENPYS